jgi:phosphoglycolate phosphatase-like HAD superfamily hydrolase
MLELVIFDADGVLFDSTESNVAYYNAIFKLIGEPPLNPIEARSCIFMSAPQIFELRAAGDPARIGSMREADVQTQRPKHDDSLAPDSELQGVERYEADPPCADYGLIWFEQLGQKQH